MMMAVKARPRRWLRLTSPRMSGEDVKRLQIGVGARLHARGRKKPVVDGVYGEESRDALRLALWLLGCPSDKLDAGATTKHQWIVRNPKMRPLHWYAIARDRTKWLAEQKNERDEFLKWCRSKVGIVETPRDSNHGPEIDRWQKEVMGNAPRPQGYAYCAIFLVFGLRKIAGFVAPSSWAYTPNILADAKAGRYGTKFHPPGTTPQPGWLILFDFGYSSDPVEHVGVSLGGDDTVEANTSPGANGHQSNGGGVYERDRGRGRNVVGYVQIPYGK